MADLARVKNTVTVDEMVEIIERDGGVIVEDFLSSAQLDALKADLLPKVEKVGVGRNPFSGYQTRRLSSLFAHTRHLADVLVHPLFHDVADRLVNTPVVYGSGDYQAAFRPGLRLATCQLIQIAPGQPAQQMHRDHWAFLWRHEYKRHVRYQVMIAVSDFTAENGATLVVPGSHHWGDDRLADHSEAVPAVMKAGSAMFFIGSTHHGGGANVTTDQYRSGLTLSLDSAAVRQEENMYLALTPEVVKRYPERIQRLLGWSYMAETNMGWVEIDGEMADPNRLLA